MTAFTVNARSDSANNLEHTLQSTPNKHESLNAYPTPNKHESLNAPPPQGNMTYVQIPHDQVLAREEYVQRKKREIIYGQIFGSITLVLLVGWLGGLVFTGITYDDTSRELKSLRQSLSVVVANKPGPTFNATRQLMPYQGIRGWQNCSVKVVSSNSSDYICSNPIDMDIESVKPENRWEIVSSVWPSKFDVDRKCWRRVRVATWNGTNSHVVHDDLNFTSTDLCNTPNTWSTLLLPETGQWLSSERTFVPGPWKSDERMKFWVDSMKSAAWAVDKCVTKMNCLLGALIGLLTPVAVWLVVAFCDACGKSYKRQLDYV